MIKKAYIVSMIVFALLALQFSCKLHDPGAPNPTGASSARYSLVVSVDPNVLQTDGIATSNVMARLYDLDGKPLAGRTVYFEVLSSSGEKINVGMFSSNYVITNSNGVALTSYTGPNQPIEQQIRIQGSMVSGDYPYQVGHWAWIWLVIPGDKPHPPTYDCSDTIIDFTVNPADPRLGEYVTFDASGTIDPTGYIVEYNWSFGDGKKGKGQTVQHRYNLQGTYTVYLTVIDSDNHACMSTGQQITVGAPFACEISIILPTPPATNTTIDIATTNGVANFNYNINFGDGSSYAHATPSSSLSVDHTYAGGPYTVTAAVTDGAGLTATCNEIKP